MHGILIHHCILFLKVGCCGFMTLLLVIDPHVYHLLLHDLTACHCRILMSTPLAIISYFLIWCVPDLDQGKVVWYLVWYCLFQTLQTVSHPSSHFTISFGITLNWPHCDLNVFLYTFLYFIFWHLFVICNVFLYTFLYWHHFVICNVFLYTFLYFLCSASMCRTLPSQCSLVLTRKRGTRPPPIVSDDSNTLSSLYYTISSYKLLTGGIQYEMPYI